LLLVENLPDMLAADACVWSIGSSISPPASHLARHIEGGIVGETAVGGASPSPAHWASRSSRSSTWP
jgi:hypothetical protein